ncbi:MAG TPA: hypothetical protein VFI91_13220 [Longimicrobiaceae bacterium]|nr:hypothetical protein [Longimicrobiaceae bacterium]
MATRGTMGAVLALLQAVDPGGLLWWVELLTAIATIIIALALIVIGLVVIPLVWKANKAIARASALVGKDLRPIIRHGETISENVSRISTSVRADVEMFQSTLVDARERVGHAAGLAEDRINQFSALLELVQEEAEDLFIDSASTIRGVKAGTERLRGFPNESARSSREDLRSATVRPSRKPERER